MELKEFIEKFANVFDDTDVEMITPDCNYFELEEWSSLTALSVIALVRTEYGKKIDAKDLRMGKTVEGLFNLIQSK